MAEPTLSIIIPAYNVAKTIVRCLDSVFVQVHAENKDQVEVLVVNDCSPDNVADILVEYQLREPRLRVITHTRNGKEAGAHNTGVRETSGEYFLRLDADDALRSGALTEVFNIITVSHPDIILHGYDTVDEAGRLISRRQYPAEGTFDIFSKDPKVQEVVFRDVAFGIMTPNVIYRREVAKGVEQEVAFPVSGDRYYGWRVFCQSHTVCITNSSFVDYYQYPTSLSHAVSAKGIEGLLELDRRFWCELVARPEYAVGQPFAFQRLSRGLLGWHYALVFKDRAMRMLFADRYFEVLRIYLTAEPTWREYGFGIILLKLATSAESSLVLGFYKNFYERFVCRIWARMRKMLSLEVRWS